MSETRDSKKGLVNLDAALSAWPEVEKAQEDWDDRAQSVMSRLRRGERGASAAYVSDENLLGPPLGQSMEDGHNSATAGKGGEMLNHPGATREGTPMTMPADRERDRRSLQELAKMAATGLTPPPPSVSSSAPSGVMRAAEAKADDSGIVDLAAASQADPSAAMRAQSTPLATQGLFDEEPASMRPPMSGVASASNLAQPAPSIPPMPASIPPASAQYSLTPSAPPVGFAPQPYAAQAAAKKKGGGGTVIALLFGGVVALSAAAAGGFFYMKSHKAADASSSGPVAMATTTPVAQPATPAVDDPPPAPATTDTPPPADEGSKIAAKPGAKVAAPPKGGIQAAPPPPAKPEPGPAKMTEKDLAAAPTGPAGDLGAAIKKEVGDKDPKPAAAVNNGSASAGNVPQKPSQGAVTGAIVAVLPQARGCLGPDDPISRASIVFGSEGSVQSVSVSGAAAGKPAEACIKGALQKAKVQPFAEPTYTANITIRHN